MTIAIVAMCVVAAWPISRPVVKCVYAIMENAK